MFGPKIQFQARIKRGTTVGHDWGYFRWPACRAPGGKDEAADPDMLFDATYDGHSFALAADGYGYGIHERKPGAYGNGSIMTFDFAGLIVSEEDREKVRSFLLDQRQAKVNRARGELEKLEADLAAVSNGDR